MLAATYQYEPLRYPDQTRLVYLHPPPEQASSSDSSIDLSFRNFTPSIEIKNVAIRESRYTALSYVWGTEDRDQPLKVMSNGSAKILNVTPRLQTALRYLVKSGVRHVWIDQLCINQDGDEDKTKQLPLMASIYNHASKVIIWLGEEADDSTLAMHFIRDISVLELHRQAKDREKRKLWSALAKLMAREWFTRRWIIQEVALAQQAELWCGDATPVSWPQFAEAVTLFESKLNVINPRYIERSFVPIGKTEATIRKIASVAAPVAILAGAFAVAVFSHRPSIVKPYMGAVANNWNKDFQRHMDKKYREEERDFNIGQIRGVGAYSLVTALDRIVRQKAVINAADNGREPERLCTIEALLSYLPTFNCGKPADVVFSILSLANDSLGICPNYQTTPYLICEHVIERTVAKTGSLNIICRPWAPILKDIKVPSWFPSLSRLPVTRTGNEGKYLRVGPDCLVGHPGQCSYKASGSFKASVEFSRIGDDKDNTSAITRYLLTAQGRRLGKILKTLDAAEGGTIPPSWFHGMLFEGSGTSRFPIQDAVSIESRKEMFWRMIVCDRDDRGGSAPLWMRRAFEELYRRSSSKGDMEEIKINTVALLDEAGRMRHNDRDDENEPSSSIAGPMTEFLTRVQAATWGRRMVRLERGLWGLVPGQAREGDVVCVLFGCDVPVVLRWLSDNVHLWSFVGEAYIQGIMDGEAMRWDCQEESFSLC